MLRLWLLTLAALVFAMVMVGGATRLTGSGLSITEWRPVTGALPPLSQAQWLEEFEKYRQIPQYQLLNRGMSLGAFQVIYWWEWGHRQLGRLLGLVFLVPFIVFVVKGTLTGRLLWLVTGLGLLGGLQGTIGWLMVASGLKPGMVTVAPIKLMLHLTLAALIFTGLLTLSRGLAPLSQDPAFQRRRRLLIGAILVQIALGALVAGSKAGLTFNTWPLMDGVLVPPASILFAGDPWIENFVDNPALIQFNHRMMAWIILGLALWHGWSRFHSPDRYRACMVAVLTLVQMGLGIVTLLLGVPLWAGLAHQALAFVVLGAAVIL
jgi:heme a synthase